MTAPALHEIAYPKQDPLRPSYASQALALMLFAMQAAGAASWSEVDSATRSAYKKEKR